jgi:spoIIIJ-associated protein
MSGDTGEVLKKLIEELATKLGFQAEVRVESEDGSGIRVAIYVREDQHYLIGQKGANLSAFQHLVKVVCRRQGITDEVVSVDVNDYVKEKRELLVKDVNKAVVEALENNISVALRPMLPYERKIVHTYLLNHPQVITESIGSEGNRKVLVRPKISTEAVVPQEETDLFGGI